MTTVSLGSGHPSNPGWKTWWTRAWVRGAQAIKEHEEGKTPEALEPFKEQLEAVHQITREVEYLPGEVIVREGDPGSELFLLIEGRVLTPIADLREALDIERGDPILAIDPARAKADLETLGWVADATVERRLPDLLYIRITERRPMALWQNGGAFAIVDGAGAR